MFSNDFFISIDLCTNKNEHHLFSEVLTFRISEGCLIIVSYPNLKYIYNLKSLDSMRVYFP